MEWLRVEEGAMMYNDVPPADYSSVGERIRQVRKENGLTQKEFAKRIKSSLDMVSKTELGKITPSSHWLETVSKEFGVSMQYLLSGVEEDGKKAEITVDRIDTFMRENEAARVAVLEAINSGNEDIWRMLGQLVREQNQG
jgi:Predicted transcriptional regulators